MASDWVFALAAVEMQQPALARAVPIAVGRSLEALTQS
jgi:hypothetical protein